jgi:hypothetical protein
MGERDAGSTATLVNAVIVMVALLALVGLGRMVIDRTLEPNDPRRRLANQVLVYGATVLFTLILVLMR